MYSNEQVKIANRIEFYGLLFHSNEGPGHVNLKGDRDYAFDVYVACASLTAQSALAHGESFTLVTNREDLVASSVARQGLPALRTTSVPFDLSVPAGIPFFEAHQKISVLRAFARGQFGARCALIDIDTVFERPVSDHVPHNCLAVYDITGDVPEQNALFINSQINSSIESRWFGGEFICGDKEKFKKLCDEVDTILPFYFENIGRFPHVGDEAIVSVALNRLTQAGVPIQDVGAIGVISRWWSSCTDHRQASFKSKENSRIFHLPADKEVLANFARMDRGWSAFAERYKRAIWLKLLVRHFTNLPNTLRGRQRYVPRLGSGFL